MLSISMQKRAGLLYLAKFTGRILLILENSKWTVPTFNRENSLFDDVVDLFNNYQEGKIVPIELYVSNDRGFEYNTYVCLVEEEFCTQSASTISWARLDYLPKDIHSGLRYTLDNQIIKTKIDTIIELSKNNFKL